MKNLFDSSNYPDIEPSNLVVGSRWAWTRSDITEAYPTASYTLKYKFSLQTSVGTVFDITAVKTDSKHTIEQGQSDTSGKTVGYYLWQAVVVRDSDNEEVVVDSGYVDLLPDLDSAGDTRNVIYTTWKAIQATIAKTATKEQASYSVAGRSLSRRSTEELMQLEREYRIMWQQELQRLGRENGRKTRKRTIVRLDG